MKKVLVVLFSFLLLSGFAFPTPKVDIFNSHDADETKLNLSNAFNGTKLEDWEFDKEQNAWLNTGFELYLNEDMTEIEYILLKNLSVEATYGLMDAIGIYPTPLTKYILENDTEFFSDVYLEEDFMLSVLTFRPLSENVTVGLYYSENQIEDILNSSYDMLTQ